MTRSGTARKTARAAMQVALLAALPPTALGQVKVESRAAEIEITGRVQAQFNTTSVDAADLPASEMLVRRARLTAEIMANDFVSGKVQPEYGDGEVTLKDAYMRLTFGPAFRATFGQFKRPFDLFELTSSTQILVIERDGRVRGVDTCGGPGGLCSYSRFTEKLGYSDRDIGAMVDGKVDRWAYMASFTNGAGANEAENNDGKSATGRIGLAATPDVHLGVNAALHDYVNEITGNGAHAFAFGGDVEYGNFISGPHVQAGLTVGDNWQRLDAVGDPATFMTAQIIGTYKRPIRGNRYVNAIEPVGRVSWGDPDTDADAGDGLLLTPGLVVYFVGRNKFAVNVDIWAPDQGDTEWSFKAQSSLHF